MKCLPPNISEQVNLKRIFYNWWYRSHPPEMVSYWKHKEAVRAKVVKADDGHYQMIMEGEKYPFPGFPRGNLLFGSLSKMKHIIKNFIFNDSWALLENSMPDGYVIDRIKREGLDEIVRLVDMVKYDMFPPSRMVPSVREIYRAFEEVEKTIENEDNRYRVQKLKEALTYILQEDDGYRFRVQWLAQFMPIFRFFSKIDFVRAFEKGLTLMEHAEVVGDMKERIRLLRRILMLVLKDKTIRNLFIKFCDEVDWKKVKLTKADKYFFRAKYFRADYPDYEY